VRGCARVAAARRYRRTSTLSACRAAAR
jgi:hypothetical protein